MNDYTPKVGRLVRVTVEGRVKNIDDDGALDLIHRDNFHGAAIAGPMISAVEPLPMPEWQPENVVRTGDGTILLRQTDGRWACSQGPDCPSNGLHLDEFLADDWATGDITVLVHSTQATS